MCDSLDDLFVTVDPDNPDYKKFGVGYWVDEPIEGEITNE